MAVNGIELQVGQEWRCRDGQARVVTSYDGSNSMHQWQLGDGSWVACDGRDYDHKESSIDLIELLSGPGFVAPAPAVPEGFTPWAGGEQPAETVGKRVIYHMRDSTPCTDTANKLRWNHEGTGGDIVAYKVVEDMPRPGVIDDYTQPDTREYTGGSVNYYKVEVTKPTAAVLPYTAECNDIIEALQMNYAEGNAFKAIWRATAARLGISKRGYTDGLYDAEKVVFYGQRMVVQQKGGV